MLMVCVCVYIYISFMHGDMYVFFFCPMHIISFLTLRCTYIEICIIARERNVVTKYDDNSFNNCERFDSMFSRHYVKEKLNCEINDYDMLLCSAIYKREEDKWHYQS